MKTLFCVRCELLCSQQMLLNVAKCFVKIHVTEKGFRPLLSSQFLHGCFAAVPKDLQDQEETG